MRSCDSDTKFVIDKSSSPVWQTSGYLVAIENADSVLMTKLVTRKIPISEEIPCGKLKAALIRSNMVELELAGSRTLDKTFTQPQFGQILQAAVAVNGRWQQVFTSIAIEPSAANIMSLDLKIRNVDV